jgi:enoyl-CoA hydratase/carnithine racemase
MSGTLKIEQQEHVLVVALVNPPHGLMDRSMVMALGDLAARADTDPSVGAVVLTGAHESRFLAHYDVAEILFGAETGPSGLSPAVVRASLRATAAARRVRGADGVLAGTPVAGLVAVEQFKDVLLSIQHCAAVWIAAINGHAMGGGCELTLACDVRYMAAGDWRIGQPEILLGFPPGGGGTQRLTRLLGTSRALRICLEGLPMTSAQALEVGLVDRTVAREELLDAAVAEARRLGRRPKAAIGAVKRAVYEGGSRPLIDGLRVEAAEFVATLSTPEALTAMRSYVDTLERTGELPAYDFDQDAELDQRGHFA